MTSRSLLVLVRTLSILHLKSSFPSRMMPKSLLEKCPLIFSPNTGKYGPEKTPYLNTFDAVNAFVD